MRYDESNFILLFFVGSLETLHITWPQKYGEIHRWFIGSQCNISISSPELVQVK
jgi:hypothetical protein